MNRDWYIDLIAEMACESPEQSWDDIIGQMADFMVSCTGKLHFCDLARLAAIAAAIKHKSAGTCRKG